MKKAPIITTSPHSPTSKEWMNELSEFISVEPVQPPKALSELITGRVHEDLNPVLWKVFLKLTFIHALVGGVTLAFCPQFGFGLTSGMGLMGLFMRFGNEACMVGCGAVFMGGSLLVASLALKTAEVRVIRRTEILQVSLLAFLSIGVFICTGSEAIEGLTLFWVMGSVIGGLGTFELGLKFRQWVMART